MRVFIIGAGRFGTYLATRLSEQGCEVVIADHNERRIRDLTDDGFHALELDAVDEDALKEAGVKDADAVVVSTGDNMQASIMATLVLKELKVGRVIARAIDVRHAQVLERVGADLVVLPTRDSAYQLAERLLSAALGDRLPLGDDYQLAHVRIAGELHHVTLAEARLPQNHRINVVLVTRPRGGGRKEVLEPTPSLRLQQHDTVLVVGRRESINAFEERFGASYVESASAERSGNAG